MIPRATRLVLYAGLAFASPAFAQEEGDLGVDYAEGYEFEYADEQDAIEGTTARLDLGEAWVPPIFAHSGSPFAPSFVALAQERFADVEEDLGRRAVLDRYLESYGIPPTLRVLRDRMRMLDASECRGQIDLATIREFAGSDLDEDDLEAWQGHAEVDAELWVQEQLSHRDVYGLVGLSAAPLDRTARRRLGRVLPLLSWRQGLMAVRNRLACEGHLRGRVPTTSQLDPRTRAALAEFERRHRIYSRGSLSGETLRQLRIEPLELLRHDLLRVLAERARLDWGVLEDGSAGDDLVHEIRDSLEVELQLQDVAGARRFLETMVVEDHVYVEVARLRMPTDYGPQMALTVQIDRGDVRYDPPFDAEGHYVEPRGGRRPSLTLFVGEGQDRRALVRWPTTVGGWRTERERGQTVWKYKESPTGPGIWEQIVAAPVWLPPASTPDADLISEQRIDDGELHTVLKRTILGPGYASAYGLAAAIHRPTRNGRVQNDEGIRSHGSVDYTSVWRRASHGCHRLQNHRAVALFSFLLAHRRHRYRGARPVGYRRTVRIGELREELTVDRSGEVWVLDPPMPYEVLPGRIVGSLQRPSRTTYPVREE